MTVEIPVRVAEELLAEVKDLGKLSSSDEVMHEALTAYIRLKRIEHLIEAASEDTKERGALPQVAATA